MNKKKTIQDLGAICVACGLTENLSIDHIVPTKLGGKDEISNYQVLCRPCNASKRQQVIRFSEGVPGWFLIRKSIKCGSCKRHGVYILANGTIVCRGCGSRTPKEKPIQ